MAVLKDDILPAAVYNTLPHIDNMKKVPVKNADDIRDLSALLQKYKLGDRVRIKLIHIHFQLKEGEVFAARDVIVPKIGPCNIMQAVPARQSQPLYGHHYFVNTDGDLAAYEYMSQPGPDMSQHQTFVREFCKLVQERHLQHTLGLSLRHSELFHATNELEYPVKRVCIDVPAEVPLPYELTSFDTTTEFLMASFTDDGSEPVARTFGTKHVHHSHCTYRRRRQLDDAEEEFSDSKEFDGKDSSDDHTTSSSDASDGHTTASSDDSDLDFSGEYDDSYDSDPTDGLCVTNGPPRQIKLAGLKLEPGAGLYKIVSVVSDHT
ncbi:hypothetical protein LTR78_005024 [Recurvomyces mirabilis]|uniref:Uncharacterized protein n=1 Tax=Recurvomyces mirabilis TaxID=574656 RepID=A0AAE1C202_9PEZI|nr:hypothetical protein LTR78_005024 [Recurvomyces mirabilis]KAK5158360.1 hypothetical protein LTS14_003378 [Recurvomyces mirabilis]